MRAAAAALRHTLFATGAYDAVHVRLGDFDRLCADRSDARSAAEATRVQKFCPPSDDQLASVFARLDGLGGPRLPVLLLSDDPPTAARRLGVAARGRLRTLGNETRLEHAPRLAVEMDLAVGARAFVGVACSTVSQLIIKRRDATALSLQLTE